MELIGFAKAPNCNERAGIVINILLLFLFVADAAVALVALALVVVVVVCSAWFMTMCMRRGEFNQSISTIEIEKR